MERGVRDLRAALAAEGVTLELLPGGEIALDRLPRLAEEELRRFGLGGGTHSLLLEFRTWAGRSGWSRPSSNSAWAAGAPYSPIPERNNEVQAKPERLARLVESGALIQLTAASLDGRLGRTTRATALRLLERGYAYLIGSDPHAPSLRDVGLSAAAARSAIQSSRAG